MMRMGYVYWITGLSGAGKTAIGRQLYDRMREQYANLVFLDGDTLREVFGNDLGYTRDERIKCAMRYARLCRMFQEQGLNVICCTISMFDCVRSWNRNNIQNYREIYIKVSMKELARRNQKGLYASKTENIAGIQVAIEEPTNSDLILENEGSQSVTEMAELVIEHFGIMGDKRS